MRIGSGPSFSLGAACLICIYIYLYIYVYTYIHIYEYIYIICMSIYIIKKLMHVQAAMRIGTEASFPLGVALAFSAGGCLPLNIFPT